MHLHLPLKVSDHSRNLIGVELGWRSIAPRLPALPMAKSAISLLQQFLLQRNNYSKLVTMAGISGAGRSELTLITGRGRRLLTVDDVVAVLQTDRLTAAKKLARWTNQGWLRRVKRSLY